MGLPYLIGEAVSFFFCRQSHFFSRRPVSTSPTPNEQSPRSLPYGQSAKMRPLTETETQTLFQKLAHYTGNSLKNLIAPLDDSPNADRYVFRIHKDRVYYVRLSIANLAVSIGKLQTYLLNPLLPPSLPSSTSSLIKEDGQESKERDKKRRDPTG